MSHSEKEKQQEVISQHPVWVVLDLDGVIARWPGYHLPNTTEQSIMLQTLQEYKNGKNLGISVLTNRPPGQMPLLAYELGVNYGYWVTESGGSIYAVSKHKIFIPERWQDFAKSQVPILRSHLRERLGIKEIPHSTDDPQFEPGIGYVKTVIVVPYGITLQEYADSQVVPALQERNFLDYFAVKTGKAVDVDPLGLSKKEGMELLLDLNKIDPSSSPTVFVADSERDIEAAEVLSQRGGKVAAVGNADPAYKETVQELGGIVSPPETSYHSSVSFILREFFQKL